MPVSVNNRRYNTVLGVLLIYFYYFDISFLSLPEAISSRKVVGVLIILFTIVIQKRPILFLSKDKELNSGIVVGTLIFLYELFLSVLNSSGSGTSFLSNCMYYVLFIFILLRYVRDYYPSLSDFTYAFCVAVFIESVIGLFQMTIPQVRTLLYNLFPYPGNRSYLFVKRASSVCCVESNGSVSLALGVVACAFQLLRGHNSRMKNTFVTIMYITIFACSFLMGRTGFLFCLVVTLYLFINLMKRADFGKILKFSIWGIVIIFIGLSILSKGQYWANTLAWALSFFKNGLDDTYFEAVQNFERLTINADTLVGSSFTRGISSSGISLIHCDIGYYRVFFALGFFVGSIYYLFIYFSIFSIARKQNDWLVKSLMYIMLTMLIVIEYKQMFVFTYRYLIFIYLFGLIGMRNYNMERL